MLRRIHSKLFAAILGTNALLALLMYAAANWSFDREFREHVRRQEEARLDTIVVALGEGYAQHAGWSWIADDPHRWDELLHSYLATPPHAAPTTKPRSAAAPADAASPGAQPGGAVHAPAPRGADTITFSPRLLLLDAQRRLLIGAPQVLQRAVLRPIALHGQVVGYLGFLPRTDLVEKLDQMFAERQQREFGVIVATLLVAAFLLSAGVARWISRPVRQLADGTRALRRGDYHVRAQVAGQDEFAQLAQDFNALGQGLLDERAARERWIADTSHELRTPLAVLRAEIEALQDGVRMPNAATLASLSQEVDKLSRLTEDLHMLSQSDLGVLRLRVGTVELSHLVHEELEAGRTILSESGLTQELALGPWTAIQGDPNRLAQLLDNLRQNTVRYTDAPGRLRVTTRRWGDWVALDWEDSAPGVPKQDLPRLTDRLYRVESSRSRASGGSGLGLAIAQAIVDAHGGRMTASASELGGLAWRIEFPASPPSGTEASPWVHTS